MNSRLPHDRIIYATIVCVTICLLLSVPSWSGVQYKAIMLPAARYGAAYDISANGEIVGQGGYGLHALIWKNISTPQDLGTLRGYKYSEALSTNGRGQLVGCSYGDSNTQMVPLIWDNAGGTRELVLPVDTIRGRANAINDSGKIVGHAVTTSGSTRAVVWDTESSSRLMPLVYSYANCLATDINAAGQMSGYAWTNTYYMCPVVWDANGTVRALESLSYFSSLVWSINSFGCTAGYSMESSTMYYQACMWNTSGEIRPLGRLPGYTYHSFAKCINDQGQVVGYSENQNHKTRAFVWDEQNGMIDLGVPTGYISTEAIAINGNGWIIGRAVNTDGFAVAMLWQPVPEPSSLFALASGVGVIVALNRRRAR